MARVQEALELLSTQLRIAQADYEWARSRGDTERIALARLKIDRIVTERDRLTDRGTSVRSVPGTVAEIIQKG